MPSHGPGPVADRGWASSCAPHIAAPRNANNPAAVSHLRRRSLLAELRFSLAQSLWLVPVEQGRDRVRARELAELARSVFTELGAPAAKNLAQVEAWLTETAAEVDVVR